MPEEPHREDSMVGLPGKSLGSPPQETTSPRLIESSTGNQKPTATKLKGSSSKLSKKNLTKMTKAEKTPKSNLRDNVKVWLRATAS